MDNNIKIITKLNRQTNDGTIKWSKIRLNPTSLENSDIIIGYAYHTILLDNKLMIYKFKSTNYNYEGDIYHSTSFRLDLVDNNFITQWSFPHDNIIGDLYDTIQYKVSSIEDFTLKFLEGEEDLDPIW